MSFGDDTLDPSNFWDGKERRSGGPMAATVDNTLNGHKLAYEVNWLNAAIHRAAMKAVEALERGWNPRDTNRTEIIEGCVRAELGL